MPDNNIKKHFPFESHSIGLPFVQRLSPQIAFIYSKLFLKKLRDVEYAQFLRAGTGWRNSSYSELLPKTLMIDVRDISEQIGYGSQFYQPKRKLSKILLLSYRRMAEKIGFPPSLYLPYLNVVFKKVKDYE